MRGFGSFHNVKIRHKLVLSFILVVFVPMLVIGPILAFELRQMALDNAIEQANTNVERVQKRTAEVLKVPSDISSHFLFDKRFATLVNTRYQSTYDVVHAYREYTSFDHYVRIYPEISGIRFYIANPTLMENGRIFQIDTHVENSFWYQSALEGRGKIGWYYLEDKTKNQSQLSLIRMVPFSEFQRHGVLVIAVNQDYLHWILDQESFLTMIVDENNTIVAINRPDWLGKNLGEIDGDINLYTETPGMKEGEVDGERSTIIVADLQPDGNANGVKVVSVFAIDEIVREANRISLMSFSVVLVGGIIVGVLIYNFSNLLSQRLLKLERHMRVVAAGNLETAIKIDGNDEIGILSKRFNTMVHNLKSLISEVKRSHEQKNQLQKKQNEIKLKMMASQIHPHFLFNVLESLRMKAHINGEREIASAIKSLGKLMRKKIEIQGGTVTLKDEMEMVRSYLEIQQFRHKERLRYELHMDQQAAVIRIPALVIQPLVENAVIHGIEKNEKGGRVKVQAQCVDGSLQIEVEDDGIGITSEKWKTIMESLDLEQPTDNHIGLHNVHSRLRLTYGGQSGLWIESSPGKGTIVRFIIPLKEGKSCSTS
ncbi:sensor histidine kinase [Desmospora activa]|uniref:histidine kinase n=1 Tax=Desmospora activa DSM 45169 TaxID=1121389 RepID=A0A2T4ZC98_9BACL|nr:histidine kinase [Desmospora activa]PTM59514.1 two-component system sensor histidine kinase YesM [Desmospora activa DSM 45169]